MAAKLARCPRFLCMAACVRRCRRRASTAPGKSLRALAACGPAFVCAVVSRRFALVGKCSRNLLFRGGPCGLLSWNILRSLPASNGRRSLVACCVARTRAIIRSCAMLTSKRLSDLRVFRLLRLVRLARGVRVRVGGGTYLHAFKVGALRGMLAAGAIFGMSVVVHPTYYRDAARRPLHSRVDIHTTSTTASRPRHVAVAVLLGG